MSYIYDGTGSGYRAKVTSSNRLKVDAVTEDTFVSAAENGIAFNINTGEITISGPAPYAADLLYVKNNESVDMEVVGWFIGEKGNRAGGDTDVPILFEMFGNPTGTPSGTAIDVVNRRIGAAREFDIEAYHSVSGITTSGSPLLYQFHYGGRAFGTVNFIIPPGQSIAVIGNFACNSASFYTGFTGYLTS